MAPRKASATPKQDVVEVKETAVPAVQRTSGLRARGQMDAGKGLSRAAEDNLIPLIYVLQPLSPQVMKRDPDYVEGAEPGDLWLRNSGMPAIKGTEGLLFQHVHFMKDWVEWKPNRGGYVGRHNSEPEDAEEKEILDERGDPRKVVMRKNGNLVVETRYHVGYAWIEGRAPIPYVIPFSSTGHTVSKGWMTQMNSLDPDLPPWGYLWRLTTKERSNAKGKWYVIDYKVERPLIEPAVESYIDMAEDGRLLPAPDLTPEQEAEVKAAIADYERAAGLRESFVSGEKTIETPEEEVEPAAGGGSRRGGGDRM